MPMRTTINPLSAPAIIPVAKQSRVASHMFPSVTSIIFEKTHAEKPSIEGKERSISPEMTTKVMASAMIPERGMVDMNE